MIKYIQKSLNMYEMGSEMFKYWLQCSAKSEILKSDEKSRKMKVLRMKLPIVENVATLRESIFTLSRGSQLPYMQKIFVLPFLPYILIYTPVWGLALGSLTKLEKATPEQKPRQPKLAW